MRRAADALEAVMAAIPTPLEATRAAARASRAHHATVRSHRLAAPAAAGRGAWRPTCSIARRSGTLPARCWRRNIFRRRRGYKTREPNAVPFFYKIGITGL